MPPHVSEAVTHDSAELAIGQQPVVTHTAHKEMYIRRRPNARVEMGKKTGYRTTVEARFDDALDLHSLMRIRSEDDDQRHVQVLLSPCTLQQALQKVDATGDFLLGVAFRTGHSGSSRLNPSVYTCYAHEFMDLSTHQVLAVMTTSDPSLVNTELYPVVGSARIVKALHALMLTSQDVANLVAVDSKVPNWHNLLLEEFLNEDSSSLKSLLVTWALFLGAEDNSGTKNFLQQSQLNLNLALSILSKLEKSELGKKQLEVIDRFVKTQGSQTEVDFWALPPTRVQEAVALLAVLGSGEPSTSIMTAFGGIETLKRMRGSLQHMSNYLVTSELQELCAKNTWRNLQTSKCLLFGHGDLLAQFQHKKNVDPLDVLAQAERFAIVSARLHGKPVEDALEAYAADLEVPFDSTLKVFNYILSTAESMHLELVLPQRYTRVLQYLNAFMPYSKILESVDEVHTHMSDTTGLVYSAYELAGLRNSALVLHDLLILINNLEFDRIASSKILRAWALQRFVEELENSSGVE